MRSLKKPNVSALEASAAKSGMKKCPYCAEMIKPEAKVCRYCSRETSDHVGCQAAAARERGAAHGATKRATEGMGYLKRESA